MPAVISRCAIVGVLLLFTDCSVTREKHDDVSAGLDEYFSTQLPPDEPGGAILIMKGDEIVFSKGYGLADMETRKPISPQTLFNLGSISKTFVSNAILLLQEQGKLSVDDSLLQYFPDFKNQHIAGKVKIKHLLTHTSGLPDNREVKKDTVFYLTAKDEENWAPVMKTDSLLFEPGTRYEYSNPAFNALALIVEKISGEKWQDFIRKNIFLPAGMRTSTITDGPHPETGVAHGYQFNGAQWVEDDYGEEPTFPASGNGGVWSSVEELARYELAHRKALFLKRETINDSRTLKTFESWTGPGPFTGWSWFIGTTKANLKTVGHTGDQGGFLCNYVSIPDKEILFVILCNTPRDVPGFTEKIFNILEANAWLDK